MTPKMKISRAQAAIETNKTKHRSGKIHDRKSDDYR